MGDRKKSQALYTIVFDDDKTFIGGTILDTKWLEIPQKKIKRIFYRLPSGDFLCLGGYNKYFHYIEAVRDLTGSERGKTKIEYAYIMGRKENKIKSYRIALFDKASCHYGNSKYKLGDVTVREFDINDEKIKKLNKKGWK